MPPLQAKTKTCTGQVKVENSLSLGKFFGLYFNLKTCKFLVNILHMYMACVHLYTLTSCFKLLSNSSSNLCGNICAW